MVPLNIVFLLFEHIYKVDLGYQFVFVFGRKVHC
jgi:hypothetical protein